MDVNAFIDAIKSVGFPIVCCGACFWMMNTTMKEFRTTVEKNTEVTTELITTVKLLKEVKDENG